MLPDEPFPQKSPAGKLPGYDGLMLCYLISGAALLPMIIGELLVAAGLIDALNETSMPSWMYGYVVLVTYSAAFTLFVAWIPAIHVCIKYRRHWRAVVPAAIVVLMTSLFLGVSSAETSESMEYAMGAVAVFYAFAAFGIGLEWLIKRAK